MQSWSPQVASKFTSLARARCIGLLCWGVCSACFGQSPPNDNFSNATPIYGDTTIFSGTLSNATYEAGESSCGCSHFCLSGGSVWWSWTATNSTAVIVDSVGDTPAHNNAGFAVCTGTDVTTLTALDCNYLGFVTNRYVAFAATAGTTYYIRMLGRTFGSFSLRLTATNAPMVLTPPTSRTLAGNSSVMLGVIAAGLPPMKYQWLFQGNNLPGQTVPTLLLHRLSDNQAGSYSVIVSNSSGVTTSAVANLVVSPAPPPVQLAVVNPPDTNRFYFTITGENGRKYRILATTNLINWAGEESFSGYANADGVVQNTSETSLFSIPRVPNQKFLRATPYVDTEICIAQLEAVYFAMKLWALETKRTSNATVAASDILSYLKDMVCPSGGTSFTDSYTMWTAADAPVCLQVPAFHIVPYQGQ